MDEVAKPGWLTGFFGSSGGKPPAPQATPKRSTKPALHQPPSVRVNSTHNQLATAAQQKQMCSNCAGGGSLHRAGPKRVQKGLFSSSSLSQAVSAADAAGADGDHGAGGGAGGGDAGAGGVLLRPGAQEPAGRSAQGRHALPGADPVSLLVSFCQARLVPLCQARALVSGSCLPAVCAGPCHVLCRFCQGRLDSLLTCLPGVCAMADSRLGLHHAGGRRAARHAAAPDPHPVQVMRAGCTPHPLPALHRPLQHTTLQCISAATAPCKCLARSSSAHGVCHPCHPSPYPSVLPPSPAGRSCLRT